MKLLLGIGDWIYGLVSIFPKLVYFITMCFVTILDVFQLAIRKLAGLDVYYINGTTEQSGDIALAFIRSIFEPNSSMPALKNAFWGLVILGAILLIVFTIVAIIRSEYSGGDNNKNKVIYQSVKSMFMFLIVPVSVFFGLMLSEIFLVALDKATSTDSGASTLLTTEVTNKLKSNVVNGQTSYINYDVFRWAVPANTQTFSGIVFQTAAFNANRVRTGEKVAGKEFYNHLKEGSIGNLGIFQYADSVEEMAKMIDEGFAHNIVFDSSAGDVRLNLGEFRSKAGIAVFTPSNNMKVTNLSKFNVGLVWVYYDLWMFNYLIAFAFIYALMKVMVNIVVGLMKRIVEIVALFIVSPPIVATMPLDDGKTFNKWREAFLARAISAVAVILAFNLVFLLLPYIQRINFMDPTVNAYKFVNILINSLIMVVALVSIESIIETLSKAIGADDLNKAGGQLVEKVGDAVKQAGTLAAGAAGVPVKAIAKVAGGAAKLGGKAANKMTGGKAGAMMNQAKDSLVKTKDKALTLGRNKEVTEAKDTAKKDFEKDSGKIYDQKKDSAMNDAFKEAAKGGYEGSKEDFMSDDSENIAAARTTAEEKFEEIHGTKEEFGNSEVEKQLYIEQKGKEKSREIISSRGKKLTAGVNYTKKTFGIDHLQSASRNVQDEFTSATVRGGKGGLKSMMRAFQGLSAKQRKEKEAEEAFIKEEKLKEKARKKLSEEKAKKTEEED